MCHVPDSPGPRLGADINPYMVALHNALAIGWVPPDTMDEKTYFSIKKNPKKYPPELVGLVGPSCSFGSTWFGGGYIKDDGTRWNGAKRRCAEEAPLLKGATFVCSSFDLLAIPPNSLVYCDPPYVGTQGYVSEFQQDWRAYKFWQWADKMVEEGHIVFVSEYKGPQNECYKLPPRTPQHTLVMESFRKLQAEMAALGDAPTPATATAAYEELQAEMAEHDRLRAEEPGRLAARWKVVWEKEVKALSDGRTLAEGEKAKTAVEKLFHREA
jgi:DNA adenine methylase